MDAFDTALASRGLGVESLLSDAPGVFVVLFALVTQLGDVWFLSLVVATLYWLGPHAPLVGHAVDRRRMAVVLGLLLLSFTLVSVAKPLLAFPRPAGAGIPPRADLVPTALEGLYAWLSTGDGFGFPSGHALGSTLVYGGLAWAVRVGSRRRRATFGVGMVALLSLSRLVLGLHFLVDVLAGAALGVVALGAVLWQVDPGRTFGLAAVVGVVGLLVVAPSVEVVAAAAAALGATLAWLTVEVPADPDRESARATVLVGATVLAVLGAAGAALHTVVPAAALLSLVGGGLLVAMPLIGERVAKKSV